MQDMKENMFAETEPALALKEIRSRDPNFDMVKFLYNLKVDVPVVIQAYLRGQVDILKEHCSKDMVERLSGIIAAQTAQVSLCKHCCLLSCHFPRSAQALVQMQALRPPLPPPPPTAMLTGQPLAQLPSSLLAVICMYHFHCAVWQAFWQSLAIAAFWQHP